jgi:hypothetical protein
MAKSTAATPLIEQPVEPVAPPRPFTMPKPLNLLVHWRHADNSGEKCAAIVTAVHATSIDVLIMPSGVHLPQPKTGVKYIADPSLKKMAIPNPGGVWELSPLEIAYQRLEQLILRFVPPEQ